MGVGAVLAYAGAPVRAALLRLTPLTVGASIAAFEDEEGEVPGSDHVPRLIRVALNLTVDGGMTLSDCDPAGTASAAGINQLCSATCVGTNLSTCTMPSAFLAGKGLKIQNNPDPLAVPPVVLMALADPAATPATGAAFVLISAGPTLGPAYNLNGQLVPTTAVVGTEEAKNANNQPLQTYYVDDDANNSSSTLHFDDIVRRPSVATIIGKANLGPRAH